MGYESYISETEASNYAGVSASTLNRFAEAGYLEFDTDNDGLRLYAKSSLEKLFSLHNNTNPQSNAATATKTIDVELGASAKPRSTYQPATQHSPTARKAEAKKGKRTVVRVVRSGNRSPAFDTLEREVEKFKNISLLQERILDMKDQSIEQLEKERDWLRSRVERLEEKNQRDQLLLLAETQTIRQLMSLQLERRSPVRAALEWLGIAKPTRDLVPSRTINFENPEKPESE